MKSFLTVAALLLGTALSPVATAADFAITQADHGSTIQMAAGDTLSLALPTAGGVPYAWTLVTDTAPLLVLISQDKVARTPGMIGGPTDAVFKFSAAAPGSAQLTLAYLPFTGDAGAAQTVTYIVNIN